MPPGGRPTSLAVIHILSSLGRGWLVSWVQESPGGGHLRQSPGQQLDPFGLPPLWRGALGVGSPSRAKPRFPPLLFALPEGNG